jgi:hypothetical protein
MNPYTQHTTRYQVCSDGMNFTAAMAKEEDAEMAVAYAPGGLHMALHIYDPNGGKNLTEYQIRSLPVHGRLYYNATGPFTNPAEPGAQLVSQFQVFARTPGVALMLTYVPDEMIRGEVRHPHHAACCVRRAPRPTWNPRASFVLVNTKLKLTGPGWCWSPLVSKSP